MLHIAKLEVQARFHRDLRTALLFKGVSDHGSNFIGLRELRLPGSRAPELAIVYAGPTSVPRVGSEGRA